MPKKRVIEKRRKKDSSQQLCAALQAVKNGRSIASVSKEYGIPRATISYKVTGKSPINKKGGPPTVLTEDEENQLVRWIFHVSSHGHPVTKSQLINGVAKLTKRINRKTHFVNGRPGRSWYEGFLNRHPEIAKRVAQNLSHSRASLTEHAVRGCFDENEAYLKKKNLENIGPERTFNGDESAFLLNPKTDHVLVPKGSKSVYQHVGNNDKESLTVLLVANAAGQLAPPMVVFNYERLPSSITANIPDTWAIGRSQTGWMTSETFFEYVTNVFEPWLTQNKIQRPVVLYIDGHSSHLTMELSNFCSEKQIELIALFPNATHIMQPLDVAFFKPLKAKYKECVTEWRLNNDGKSMKRENCAPILKEAVEKIDCKKIIINGFKKCDLSPLNADAIDYSTLNKYNTIPPTDASNNKNTSDGTSQCSTSTNNYLELFEKDLDEILLAKFHESESTGVWQGEVQHTSLFNFWLNARRRFCPKATTTIPHPKKITPNMENNNAETVNNINSNNEVIIGQNIDEIPILVLDVGDDLDLENLFIDGDNLSSLEPAIDEVPILHEVTDESDKTPVKSESLEKDRIIPENVPSPFKSALFWPKREACNKNRNRKPKQKIPSAATSEEWKAYHIQKQKEKEQKELETAERKKKRQEAAEERKKVAEERKRERMENKAQKETENKKKKKKTAS